jgi:glutaredoxin
MHILYGIVCRNFHIAEKELLSVGIIVKKVAYSNDIKAYIENASKQRAQFPSLFYNNQWYIGISQIFNLIKSKKELDTSL